MQFCIIKFCITHDTCSVYNTVLHSVHFVHFYNTQSRVVYCMYIVYSSMLHSVKFCVIHCIILYHTVYNALIQSLQWCIKIGQFFITHCTIVYYTVHDFALVQCFIIHSVQYCATKCTMLCYIMYNAVLHCVKCCITHCTLLYYTLYNRV